jgi:uncharacterized membrane protein
MIYPLLILHIILLPWIVWEYYRRYSGSYPLAYAIGISLFPIVSWMLAFRVLNMNINSKVGGQRNINATALMSSLFLSFSVIFLVLAFIVLASSLYVSKEGWMQIYLILAVFLILSVFSVVAAFRYAKVCRRKQDNQ